MRAVLAITAVITALFGCGPEEPRDPKVPLPKTLAAPAVVPVEPAPQTSDQPTIMRAVLRCQLDAQGRNRCQLDVPRTPARMG